MSNKTITIRAEARELDTCDRPNSEEPGGDPDTWTISIRETVVTLRN